MSRLPPILHADRDPVPLRPVPVHARNPDARLPISISSFVGREAETAAVSMLLRRLDVRLVTLTGPGGVGKTRLALSVAEEVAADFDDGVAFVPLASVHDPKHVARVVADALGLLGSGERRPAEAVKSYLHDRAFLLVVDNVEHLVPAVPLLAEWLSTCPRLTVLATSRAVLRLTGEHDFAVAPLHIPDLDGSTPLERLIENPAVSLFVERARAARTDFVLTENDLRAIATICVQLDGLPLAIELAAARVQHLPPGALIARLERRLTVLTGGPRDQPDRLRTMRDAVAWSDDLLTPDQRDLFYRLAVIVGSFSLDGASAVAGGDVFDGVAALVDNSLLRQETAPEIGPASAVCLEPRYSMLETIREYALEQLEARGEAERARQAHAAHFVALAERADPAIWGGPEHKQWLNHLEAELPNLRAALAWLAATDDRAGFLRLAAALGGLWHFRSYRIEGRDWLRRALARDDGTAPAARATALVKVALLDRDLDGVRSPALVEEAIELRRALGLELEFGHNLMLLATMLDARTDADRIAQAVAEATAIVERLDDPGGLAFIRARAGRDALERGERDSARALVADALELVRREGSPFHVSGSLLVLGGVDEDCGDIAAAAGHFAECLRLWDDTGSRECIVAAVAGIGRLAVAAGKVEEAARLLGAAEALGAALGYAAPLDDRARNDRAGTTAGVALGDVRFAAAQAAGAALSFDGARAEAEACLRALTAIPNPSDSRAGAPRGVVSQRGGGAAAGRRRALRPRDRRGARPELPDGHLLRPQHPHQARCPLTDGRRHPRGPRRLGVGPNGPPPHRSSTVSGQIFALRASRILYDVLCKANLHDHGARPTVAAAPRCTVSSVGGRERMKRRPIATLVLVTAILALAVAAGALAQGGPPPADATPGATGITNVVLSELDPVAAGGYGMDMREFTWEPGSFITPHTHPAAFIICVEEGAVGFSIQSGAATVTRGGTADSVAAAESMAAGDEVVLEPRDCVAVDEEPSTIHTVWNASDQTAVTIETYLFARDEPGRTFVNAEGTPIPQ